jgi:hypothetical protein
MVSNRYRLGDHLCEEREDDLIHTLVYKKKAPNFPTVPDLPDGISEQEEYCRVLLAEGAKAEKYWWQSNQLPLASEFGVFLDVLYTAKNCDQLCTSLQWRQNIIVKG